MTWICAGLYAEGPTDYRFLVALLDNLLPQIATEALPEIPIVGQTVAIDARTPAPSSRAERIVAAIDSYRAECNLFVVHADADNDPEAAVRDRIHPGLALASQRWPDIALATCVPVRAIEAWMLVDPDVFVTQIEQKTPPDLPRDPERVADPKQVLAEVLAAPFKRRAPNASDYYEIFGSNVRLAELRRLPAFQRFEASLTEAVRVVARPSR